MRLLDDAGDTINFIELSNNEFVKLPNCINAATKKLRASVHSIMH